MKIHRYLAVASLAGMLAAGGAYARGCDGMEGGRHHGGFGPFAAAYKVDNLTPEQRQQLDKIRDEQRKLRKDRVAEREALHDAMKKGADEKTLRPLAEKAGQRVTDMIMQRAALRAEVEKILTDAQRAQIKAMVNSRRGHKERHDRRGM